MATPRDIDLSFDDPARSSPSSSTRSSFSSSMVGGACGSSAAATLQRNLLFDKMEGASPQTSVSPDSVRGGGESVSESGIPVYQLISEVKRQRVVAKFLGLFFPEQTLETGEWRALLVGLLQLPADARMDTRVSREQFNKVSFSSFDPRPLWLHPVHRLPKMPRLIRALRAWSHIPHTGLRVFAPSV